MSRSDYTDDPEDQWALIRWRGAVNSALRGKRGQLFLKEMLRSLDALPAPRLITEDLERDGDCCAIGSVGLSRGMSSIAMESMTNLGNVFIASKFGIAQAMVREIEFVNDECDEPYKHPGRPQDTPEERFIRVRAWVEARIKCDT